jgi:hypothetical protein
MNRKANNDTGRKRIVLTDRLVQNALAQAAADAVEAHRKAGVPLVVWGDGEPVLISPDDVTPTRSKTKLRRKPVRKPKD